MKYSIKNLEDCKIELTVEVDADFWKKAQGKAFNKLAAGVSIPGFRKGKATRGMVERYYGEGVFYEDAFEIVYPDAVEEAVKEARLAALMEQQQKISLELNERWIGRELTMLVEETGMDGTYGRTIREAPDADGTVCIAPSYRHEPGQYLAVRLTGADSYDMIGECI